MAAPLPKPSQAQGAWSGGVDSNADLLTASEGFYRHGMNVLNARGLVRSRKPLRLNAAFAAGGHCQALAPFVDDYNNAWLVAVVGGYVYASQSPFTYWFRLTGQVFRADARQVYFASAIKSAQLQPSGELKVLTPTQSILVLSDGFSVPAIFDGRALTLTSPGAPNYGVPVGTTLMCWSGNRLWCARGKEVIASNIGAPDQFTESTRMTGGTLAFRREVTMLLKLSNKDGMLIGTNRETVLIQTSISKTGDLTETLNSQTSLFDDIGCVAPKSPWTHLGNSGWLSAAGIITLDEAQRTYQRSTLVPVDQPMREAKGRLSPDVSQVCSFSYRNLLGFSVPAGDKWNRETWLRDSNTGAPVPAWAGSMIGVLPAEWATVQDGSGQRLFCLARGSGTDATPQVWEYDALGAGYHGQGDADWPLSQAEFFVKGSGGFDPSEFQFAGIELVDCRGPIEFRAYVAPARSRVHRQVMEKRLDAGVTFFHRANVPSDASTDFVFTSQRAQGRMLYTGSLPLSTDDAFLLDRPEFQHDNNYQANKDWGFYLLLEWRGECAVRSVRVFSDPKLPSLTSGDSGNEPIGVNVTRETGRIAPTYLESLPVGVTFNTVPFSQTNPQPPV